MRKMKRAVLAMVAWTELAACSTALCAQATAQRQVGIADGAVKLKDLNIPLSTLLSREAQDYMIHLLRDQPFSGGPSAAEDIQGYRAAQDAIMHTFLTPMRKRYAVEVTSRRIGGVRVDEVVPKEGISAKNLNRVLLNLHGGGFLSGAGTASLVESIPIAAIGKIKVISIDYRMAPEYHFPAASEDVASVYQQILKEYSPQHIGIYGCSAGGMLTSMSVAWFEHHNLPQPAAVGVLCASLNDMFAGDSGHLALPLNGINLPPLPAGSAAKTAVNTPDYLRNANKLDPLVYPIHSKEILAAFPPTLFVTSTRAFEFSSVVDSHHILARQGVQTELYVWDGLPHAFWYNSDLPESREVYDVIVRFFERHLKD